MMSRAEYGFRFDPRQLVENDESAEGAVVWTFGFDERRTDGHTRSQENTEDKQQQGVQR